MSRAKVLLVDDEIEYVNALAERLRIRNYNVSIATNSNDAISSVINNAPEVVILDLRLPGLDGIEILKIIKKINPKIQVILLTGHGSTEKIEEGIKDGAFEYVLKPIDIEELIIKIDKARKMLYRNNLD